MKQCAGCGKRYDKAQITCPHCWNRTWVAAPEGGGTAVLPENAVTCTECGYLASAGMAKCPNCKKHLRPRVLEAFCVLGMIGSPLALIYLIYLIVSTHDYWLAAGLPGCVAAVPLCWRLLKGEYRALYQLRRLLIALPVLYLLLSLLALLIGQVQANQHLATLLLFQLFGGVLIWLFFLLRGNQDYCAVGKPKEHYHPHAVFGEQLNASKTERVGSSITRNL
ncbi:MAG: hypothetical protein ACYDCO_04820 [Armatimonadota bacterium]